MHSALDGDGASWEAYGGWGGWTRNLKPKPIIVFMTLGDAGCPLARRLCFALH